MLLTLDLTVLPLASINSAISTNLSDPLALNYGIIGFMVAHEISHAFDTLSTGIWATQKHATFYQNKTIKTMPETMWATNTTDQYYRSVLSCLQSQFQGLPYPGFEAEFVLDGQQTLNENFADLVGIEAAYQAFEAQLNPALAFNHDYSNANGNKKEMFFVAFAKVSNIISDNLLLIIAFCQSFLFQTIFELPILLLTSVLVQ